MPHTIVTYRKTAKGSQAIASKDHALGPRLRSLLILVDGKRQHKELVEMSGLMGDAPRLLDQLVEQGYAEAAPHVVTTPSTAAAVGTHRTGVTLSEAQRLAVRRLTDILGPMAEEICIAIESTRNAHEFMRAMKAAQLLLRDVEGGESADNFVREIEAHRPDS
jgi:4-hydroxy-3-methylbut-2-enyl diphosphate reductase IspH